MLICRKKLVIALNSSIDRTARCRPTVQPWIGHAKGVQYDATLNSRSMTEVNQAPIQGHGMTGTPGRRSRTLWVVMLVGEL
jgi:hypothetical protein